MHLFSNLWIVQAVFINRKYTYNRSHQIACILQGHFIFCKMWLQLYIALLWRMCDNSDIPASRFAESTSESMEEKKIILKVQREIMKRNHNINNRLAVTLTCSSLAVDHIEKFPFRRTEKKTIDTFILVHTHSAQAYDFRWLAYDTVRFDEIGSNHEIKLIFYIRMLWRNSRHMVRCLVFFLCPWRLHVHMVDVCVCVCGDYTLHTWKCIQENRSHDLNKSFWPNCLSSPYAKPITFQMIRTILFFVSFLYPVWYTLYPNVWNGFGRAMHNKKKRIQKTISLCLRLEWQWNKIFGFV